MVDAPAIRRTFLVIKRLNNANQEKTMGAFQVTTDSKTTEVQKSEGAKTPETKAEVVTTEKSIDLGAAVAAELQKLGITKSEVVTEKADVPTALVTVGADGAVTVAKAASFTSARKGTLKEAFMGLGKLMKEVDAEAFKASVDAFKADLPDGTPPGQMVTPMATSSMSVPMVDMMKEAVTKAVEPIQKSLNETNAKLVEIEKARAPTTSVSEAGGTDKKVETKKNLWSNVL